MGEEEALALERAYGPQETVDSHQGSSLVGYHSNNVGDPRIRSTCVQWEVLKNLT